MAEWCAGSAGQGPGGEGLVVEGGGGRSGGWLWLLSGPALFTSCVAAIRSAH